jgi:hypothetical protein
LLVLRPKTRPVFRSGFLGPPADNRTLPDLEERFLCALDDETGVFYFLDPSDYSAVCYDLIVDFQLRDHLLQLLFLAFLRQDHKKIKDPEYKDERKQCPNDTAASGVLKEY